MKHVSIRLKEDTIEELRKEAKKYGVGLTTYIRIIVEQRKNVKEKW